MLGEGSDVEPRGGCGRLGGRWRSVWCAVTMRIVRSVLSATVGDFAHRFIVMHANVMRHILASCSTDVDLCP